MSKILYHIPKFQVSNLQTFTATRWPSLQDTHWSCRLFLALYLCCFPFCQVIYMYTLYVINLQIVSRFAWKTMPPAELDHILCLVIFMGGIHSKD